MNRESIIKMLKQAGLIADGEWWFTNFNNVEQDVHISYLEAFAAIVASAEREACAQFIEHEYVRQFERPWRVDLSAAIRARGQA